MDILIIIAIGFLGDYFSKLWALNTLKSGKTVDLIKGYLDFEYLENRGAAFGLFQGKMPILGILSLVIVIVLLIHLLRMKEKDLFYRFSVALIISGALGNMYDRFFRGYVVDFIHFHLDSKWHFPTFNVADMLVVIGAFLMIIHLIKSEDKSNKVKTNEVKINEGSKNERR